MPKVFFTKMHGCGNDFVIIDNRINNLTFSPEHISFLSNRRFGIGCDQFIVIGNSNLADCFMHIYNQDGSVSAACGNATRCVAWLLDKQFDKKQGKIETLAGLLSFEIIEEFKVKISMGKPSLFWQDIPLANEQNDLYLPIELENLKKPIAVSMGNPHMVFFVEDVGKIDLLKLGPTLEYHPLFPKRANVGVAQIISDHHIKLRVFERGAGETLACGSGACASFVAACKAGYMKDYAVITQAGGELTIEWQEGEELFMTGPVFLSFKGEIDLI
jgi:diaminopimelate epimerase